MLEIGPTLQTDVISFQAVFVLGAKTTTGFLINSAEASMPQAQN